MNLDGGSMLGSIRSTQMVRIVIPLLILIIVLLIVYLVCKPNVRSQGQLYYKVDEKKGNITVGLTINPEVIDSIGRHKFIRLEIKEMEDE